VIRRTRGVWQSGLPFSVVSGRGTLTPRTNNNTAGTTLKGSELARLFQFRQTGSGPYLLAASAIGPDGRPLNKVLSHPSPGAFGTLQRNYFSNPSVFSFDTSVMKRMKITERQAVELRFDIFNALNHPIWSLGDQNLDSPSFGRLYADSQRLLQVGLRICF